MRKVAAISLAALLSLLMFSSSVSASACDLSCWLRQARPDCHGGDPGATKQADMSMSSDMDMGPEHGHSAMATNITTHVAPRQVISMSPQAEIVTHRIMRAAEPGMRTEDMPDHSRSISSCTHETCSQIWASVPPPSTNHAQRNFLHYMQIRISSPLSLQTNSRSIRFASLPEFALLERLVTILRI